MGPFSFTFAKRFIPITAKIYRIRTKRPPTFIKAGSVVRNVEKMFCSAFKFRKSLKILPILRARKTCVAELSNDTLKPYFKTMKISDPITIMKSKTFQ